MTPPYDRALRVWCVNQNALPPDAAGGTRHVHLASSLKAQGVEMTVVAAPIHYSTGRAFRTSAGRAFWSEDVGGVSFVWIDQKERGFGLNERFRAMLSFTRRVQSGRWAEGRGWPDVVVGSSPNLFAAWGAQRLAARHGVPFVLEVRDVWPQSIVDVAGVSPWHPGIIAMRRLERFLYRQADAIVTLLPDAGDHVRRNGGTVVTWVPNGVPLGDAPAPRSPGMPVRVIYAGAHGPANALGAVVKAARQVHQTHGDDVVFEFYGDGPLKEALRKVANGIDTIQFYDSVPRHEIPAVLASADVLIANMLNIGLYRHGISFNKLFDYFAAGRPIVFGTQASNDPVTASGGGISVTANDPTALADAVRRLADASEDERQAMGSRGRAYVEANHQMDMLAARFASVLRKVKGEVRI